MTGKVRPLIAVVGPTGSGKSALAIDVARDLDCEIVSCDALQVYRGLDIGTGKLSFAERKGIPHHMMDFVPPDAEFSAAEYVARAVPIIEAIGERGRIPLLVGGTGLYLRSLRRGLFEGPGRSPEIRARLTRLAEHRGIGALHRILRRWDASSAARIHANDRVRLIRALEVTLSARRPMSVLMSKRERPLRGFHDILVGLLPDRRALGRRIARRVDSMFELGFVEEVRGLVAEFGDDVPAFKAIGYREVRRVISGELDEASARERITKATQGYAKRQLTWFRREEGVSWFDGSGDEPHVREAVMRFLERELSRLGRGTALETLHAETTP